MLHGEGEEVDQLLPRMADDLRVMVAAVVIMIDSIRRWLGTGKHPQLTQITKPIFEKSV